MPPSDFIRGRMDGRGPGFLLLFAFPIPFGGAHVSLLEGIRTPTRSSWWPSNSPGVHYSGPDGISAKPEQVPDETRWTGPGRSM